MARRDVHNISCPVEVSPLYGPESVVMYSIHHDLENNGKREFVRTHQVIGMLLQVYLAGVVGHIVLNAHGASSVRWHDGELRIYPNEDAFHYYYHVLTIRREEDGAQQRQPDGPLPGEVQ